jgi:serine protease
MRFKIGFVAPTVSAFPRGGALLGLCLALLSACSGGGGGGSSGTPAQLVNSTALCIPSLTPCTTVQLGGAVTESNITVNTLFAPVVFVEQGRTPSLEEVRQGDGPTTWDSRSDRDKLSLLGTFINDDSLYDPTLLYLVTANGGLDQDADADNQIDTATAAVTAAAASTVLGAWHAILPGDLINTSKVTPLTEAVYRYLEPDLQSLTVAEIMTIMNSLARSIVGDVNGSGDVDYSDLLGWDRHSFPEFYLHDITPVNELSAAVRGNATAATLRQLSLSVLQLPADSGQTFTLTGSIAVPPTHRVDGDVNNPAAPVTDNNSLDTAQPIDNPIVLGGYLNVAGEGFTGRSSEFGDLDDYYRANLTADQVITLIMSEDPATNDLDLYLYDTDGIQVDASTGITGVEELTVPADGEYIIRVNAWEDPVLVPQVVTASNYQLTVGDPPQITSQVTAQGQLRLSDDFLPGQVIARFRDRPQVNSLPRRARFTGMRVRAGGLRRANLLQIDLDPVERLAQRKLKTMLAVKRLLRLEEVESAGLNYRVRATIIPNDPFYNRGQSWHYGMISLPAAWDRALGDEVIVAVIDSGIRSNHPDLIGQLLGGYDFFENDNNPLDTGDSASGPPSSFHGTHVAGTVAAASNNGSGVAGVAWNAKIMPLRVLGPGGGTSYDVNQAVRYAAGLSNDSGTVPAQRADIINLSLAGGGFNAFDQALYTDVTNLGVIVVAAAGNDASSQFAYPASYEGVISVSAVNINRARAPYSNFGSAIDVAAPGGDSTTGDSNLDGAIDVVLSTGADDTVSPIQETYTLLEGTSMASPHVAGTIALMKSVYPALTPEDVDELLSRGLLTDDLGSAGRDNNFGWGLINALKAVQVAEDLADGGGITLEPSVCTSASELNFGNFADALPLSITNCGTGTLIVEGVTTADTWVAVTPNTVDANGVGGYTVRVDRSELPVGRSFSSLDIRTNDKDVSVQIVVEQPEPGTLGTGDAGVHYILLMDALSGEIFHELELSSVDGFYAFEFTEVPAGSYQIIGGSDADNDLFICDPGEACGAWPALDSDQPEILVDQDIDNLNFTTSFNDGVISNQQVGGSSQRTSAVQARRSAYRGPGGER